MPDPMSGGATWLHCSDCGFCGDTIELYCKMHNHTEIREGIYRAISDGVAGAITDITDLVIGLYIECYPAIRAKHQAVWKMVNGHVTDGLTPEIIGRLQADHLWTGWRGNGRDRFSMCLGAARRREIVHFFPGEREVMPREFKVPLVVNYQDVPGRISAFNFIGETGELALKVLGTEVRQQAFEGGLAMLDFLRPFEGTVFAVGNPVVALHLHKLSFMDSNIPAKIICYNECTSSAWQYVNAKKVVFWDDQITWRTFDQAKRVQNAEIAARPNPHTNEWHSYFADTTVGGTLLIMERSAKPWHQFFAEWITDIPRDEDARQAIQLLALNQYDYNKVLESCSISLRKKVESLFQNVKPVTSIIVNKHRYVEQDDGWWEMHPRVGKDLVSDAVIKVGREVCDSRTGMIYWAGAIKFHGQSIPFNCELEKIEKSPVKWMREVLGRAGLGSPITRPNTPVLVTLAKAFSNPKTSVLQARVGVQADGSFVMPCFTMVDGRVTPIGDASYEYMPATGVSPPLKRSDFEFEPLPGQAAWLAMAAVYVAQQVSVLHGLSPRSVAVVGSPGMTGRAAVRHLATTTGMLKYIPSGGKLADAKAILENMRKFDYSYFIEPETPGRMAFWPQTPTNPVFVAANIIEAAAFGAMGNWIVVVGNDKAKGKLPGMDVILHYIAHLQQREYKFEGSGTFERLVLYDMCEVLNIPPELRKMADASLLTMTPGEWMVKLCQLLLRTGNIPFIHRSFTDAIENSSAPKIRGRVKYVMFDDVTNKVLLMDFAIREAIRRNIYPTPDLYACGEDLIRRELATAAPDTVGGWVLELAEWNRIGLIHLDRPLVP